MASIRPFAAIRYANRPNLRFSDVIAPPYDVLDDAGKAADKDKKGPVKLGKDGKPSEANHGNVTPTIADRGGVTISKAVQTTVLSLPGLRRLRFPLNGKSSPKTDDAARTALAALGLCRGTGPRARG